VSSLNLTSLADDLRTNAFAAPAGSPPRRIGAEVEFIPVEALTGRRCAIESDEVTSTLPLLRRVAAVQDWVEGRTSKGTPCFSIPDGGAITYEPGGQLEYSSPPCPTASSLLAVLRSVVLPLRTAARAEGIDLLATGIDPFNSADDAPMLVSAERYDKMAEYFATIGPSGAQMMRQTASFQINLDFDQESWLRWRVLNALAPYVTAIFANSPVYARCPSGYQSTRAAVWRGVDRSRTGIAFDPDRPVECYREFALAAPAMLLPTVEGRYPSFAEWLSRGSPSLEQWHDHLSTLFPEVRPRGHLELRSADSIAPEWYAAPIALTAGMLYNPPALRATADLLGMPDPRLLERAGRCGLRDPAIATMAMDLFEVALQGCQGLGERYFHPADLEEATAFFDRYTRCGRSPADDMLESAIAA
jgi:glutamate--cysteine ligase